MDVEVLSLGRQSEQEGAHRTRTFGRILEVLNIEPGTATVDLGAGPCIFARIASRHGLLVTAVDGRTDRVPPEDELGSIKFVQADVRHFDLSGFLLILMLGLLYHLEIREQADLLRRASKAKYVIVDTQVHVPALVCTPHPQRFSDVRRTSDGYEGVEFGEVDNPMAAIANKTSFWHTEQSMRKLFEAAGYSRVTLVDPAYQSIHGARRFYILHADKP